jgi:hypothetical protein
MHLTSWVDCARHADNADTDHACLEELYSDKLGPSVSSLLSADPHLEELFGTPAAARGTIDRSSPSAAALVARQFAPLEMQTILRWHPAGF